MKGQILKSVITRLAFSSLLGVVCQVEELQEQKEPIAGEQTGKVWRREWPARAPVIL